MCGNMYIFADTHIGSSHSRKKGYGAEVEWAGGRRGQGPHSPVLTVHAQALAPTVLGDGTLLARYWCGEGIQ